MKVFYILNSTLTTGGATKAIMGLVPLLEKKGVIPIFLVPDNNGIYASLLSWGYETHFILFKMSIYPNFKNITDRILFIPKLICRLLINIVALCKIKKLIKTIKPDIIHTNTSVVSLGRIVAKWENIPHVQHIREYANKDFSMKYFPSWTIVHNSLKKNAYNVCITKDIQRHHELIKEQNAQVVYDGVHNYMHTMPNCEKDNILLYAGRIEYGKGLDILLEAYKCYVEMTQKPFTLYVAGGIADTSYFNKIKKYIDDCHLNDYIVFLGIVDNIESYMQKARTLIIPSRSEGFGFSMPEAMFNGCLCIGHYTAGIKEQMKNGVEHTGKDIALAFLTKKELVEKLIEVHNSKEEKWTNMLKQAFNTVNSLYTHEQSAKAIFTIYKTIIGL